MPSAEPSAEWASPMTASTDWQRRTESSQRTSKILDFARDGIKNSPPKKMLCWVRIQTRGCRIEGTEKSTEQMVALKWLWGWQFESSSIMTRRRWLINLKFNYCVRLNNLNLGSGCGTVDKEINFQFQRTPGFESSHGLFLLNTY